MYNNFSYIELIKDISFIAIHEKDVHKLFNEVLSKIEMHLGMERIIFTLLHNDVLKIEASRGLTKTEISNGVYKLGEGIIGHVAITGRPHLINDISKDNRFLNRATKRDSSKSIAFICVPIFHNEKVIGTLSADKENETSDIKLDMQIMEIIGNIMAEAAYINHQENEEKLNLINANNRLRAMLDDTDEELIGSCKSMRNVFSLIKQVASSDATVLIRGSTGTGKELVAKSIVKLSSRSNKPFVTLNCGALPDTLIESELFGYEKGAFTGAVSRKLGKADIVNGGTLFLDEVGDLSLNAQIKLLRFIQEHTFMRLGGSVEIKSDVRFIGATSRNLEELMKEGRFREDLYYRLNVFPIIMPDLSERKSDIILLAEHFIEKYNIKYNKNVKRLSAPAINLLMSYAWYGNVRELENCIERALLTSNGECIYHYDLSPSLQRDNIDIDHIKKDDDTSLEGMLDDFERGIIVATLKRFNWNMSSSAKYLKISPRVIHYKINKLNITKFD